MIRLYFDGACTPINPGGVGTWGFKMRMDSMDFEFEAMGICEDGKSSTNNVAEYYGLIEGLAECIKRNFAGQNIFVFGDSSLVCNMAAGVWGKKNPHKKAPHLIPLLERVHLAIVELNRRGNRVSIQWIPRESNTDADALTKSAYKEYANRT